MTTYTDRQKECIAAADALEAEYLAVANGTKKPAKIALEPLVRAVEALRGKAEVEFRELVGESTPPITGFSEPDGGADGISPEFKEWFRGEWASYEDKAISGGQIVSMAWALKGYRAALAAPSQPAAPAEKRLPSVDEIMQFLTPREQTFVSREAVIPVLKLCNVALASAAPSTAAQGATLTDEQVKSIAETLGFTWHESPDEHGQSFFSHDGCRILNMFSMRKALAAAPTPVADSGAMTGHAINELFLQWSEWTTELGEAISRKNIDGFVGGIRALAAAKPVSVDAAKPIYQIAEDTSKTKWRDVSLDEYQLYGAIWKRTVSVDAGGMTLQQAALAHATEQGAAACVIPIADTELIVAVGTRENLAQLLTPPTESTGSN